MQILYELVTVMGHAGVFRHQAGAFVVTGASWEGRAGLGALSQETCLAAGTGIQFQITSN